MNKEIEDYYTRIEDLEDELPDRVINDLNQLKDDDDSSISSIENIVASKSTIYSTIGDVFVVFLIITFVLNKRFIKFIGEYNINLPKNIIMAIISSLLYSIYKIILSIY